MTQSTEIASPEWDKAERVHDWRNYISERVRRIWGTFTSEQKDALFEMADEMATREEWE